MTQALLTTESLGMRCGGLAALDDVYFTMDDRSITSVIGHNGADKTTLFNSVTGMYQPTSGRVLLSSEDTGYYGVYNRENVKLVDLKKTPIEEVTANGVRTTAAFHELDALVCATGYDALTDAVLGIDLITRDAR